MRARRNDDNAKLDGHTHSEFEELQTRIANYKRTRRTAAPSLHPWLDHLIADAQAELHRLTGAAPAGSDDASPPAAGVDPDNADALARDRKLRRHRHTYPFDDQAPWQRIDGAQ
jgi:hypothetical protein